MAPCKKSTRPGTFEHVTDNLNEEKPIRVYDIKSTEDPRKRLKKPR